MKKLVNNFKHYVGKHCESSAMRDLFEFHGFPMSEAMVFGLDATFGFGFWKLDSATSYFADSKIPFFFGGKQGTIEPDSLACRILGINIRKQTFSSADSAWEDSKSHLDNDDPLIIQTDLAYLPHFIEEREKEGSEEFHFGLHQISLGGYDTEKDIALIADTDQEEFIEVPIDMLKKARSSTFGPTFMHPKNAQFSMQVRPDGKRPPFAAGVKLCIKKVVDNMLRSSVSNGGILGMKNFVETIPDWKDSMANIDAKLGFKIMTGYIDDWGTGGQLFRSLYGEYLKELTNHPELKSGIRAWTPKEFESLDQAIQHMDISIENWIEFSKLINTAAKEHGDQCAELIDLGKLSEIGYNILENEEKTFNELAKIKL